MTEAKEDQPQVAEQQQNFAIQRIFLKDASFESPNSPDMFRQKWSPDIKLDLNTETKELGKSVYEVTLRVTVTGTNDEQTAFICEVHQAGIFTVQNMTEQQLAHCIGAFCPNILFPYARETVSSLVSKGTFPQLDLAPVNFDALFMNYLKEQTNKTPQEATE